MKNVRKQIENDCIKLIIPCFPLNLFEEVSALTLPVITSWMIGNMADALISLNTDIIYSQMAIFLLAFTLDVFAFPLIKLWKNILLTKNGFKYGNFMMNKYLHLPMSYAVSLDSASLVEKLDNDTTEYYFLIMQKWTRPITMIIYLIALISLLILQKLHPAFILTMLIAASLPLIRAFINGKQRANIRKDEKEYKNDCENMEFGMYDSKDFLCGFNLLDIYINRIHEKFLCYSKKTGNKKDMTNATDQVFSYICNYGVPVCVITVGALLIALNKMTVGALLAGYLIIPTLTEFYRYFENLVLNYHQEKMVSERLEIFYKGYEDEGNICDGKEFKLKNLCFSYKENQSPVFNQFNLTIPLQKVIQLTGENGCGKSTLMMMLAGIYLPNSGSISLDENSDFKDLRKTVSFGEQDGQIFSASVFENLFITKDKFSKAENLLKRFEMNKPMDYQVGENGKNLSPGEKKKILLTRAILKPSKILALDEPLNHLDTHGSHVLIDLLKNDNRNIVLISHLPINIPEKVIKSISLR